MTTSVRSFLKQWIGGLGRLNGQAGVIALVAFHASVGVGVRCCILLRQTGFLAVTVVSEGEATEHTGLIITLIAWLVGVMDVPLRCHSTGLVGRTSGTAKVLGTLQH